MALTNQDWLKAQNSVLGSALIEPKVVRKVMVETCAADYSGACRTVYDAMHQVYLSGKPVDPVSVCALLGPDHRDFVVQLMDVTPTAANIDHYIALCREQAQVLSVREMAQQMAVTEDSETLRSLLDQASARMADKRSVRSVDMTQALTSFYDRHTKPVAHMTLPIPDLNNRVYIEPGDLVVLGGYPSAGKTALALQMAWHWAGKYKVGFYSFETSDKKLFDRQVAAVAGIPLEDIKLNRLGQEEWDKICALSGEITSRRLDLISAAGMTPADIRSLTLCRGYDIIVIDYLQLIQVKGDNRTAVVTGISLALHTLAQSLGVTVVALSQLTRPAPGTTQPTLHQLRESGQIEQDADVVMLLSLEDAQKRTGPRILNVAKNKEGICPKILLAFDGRHQTFHKANPYPTTRKPPQKTPVLAEQPAP